MANTPSTSKVSHSQISRDGAAPYNAHMSLNLRIRELRQARGWSVETLAGKVSISTPHMSQVERGIKNLNNRLIDELSAALGVEPFELFAPRQDRDSTLRVMADLSDDDRARVEAFAAALASTRQPDSK